MSLWYRAIWVRGGIEREIYDLGYEIGRVEDGRITFTGDEEAICRANIFLRTAERVLIQVGRFHAETFEELFQGIKALPWENYIPENGKFWVKKHPPSRVNCSVRPIFSRSRKSDGGAVKAAVS